MVGRRASGNGRGGRSVGGYSGRLVGHKVAVVSVFPGDAVPAFAMVGGQPAIWGA